MIYTDCKLPPRMAVISPALVIVGTVLWKASHMVPARYRKGPLSQKFRVRVRVRVRVSLPLTPTI